MDFYLPYFLVLAGYLFDLDLGLDLVLGSISFSESNMYQSELSTALGQEKSMIIWSLSDLVLEPEQVGHFVRVGGTLRTLFLI